MDAQLKAKWVEALRSGKYEQAQRRLRTLDNRCCCLGVLRDVAGLQWFQGKTGFRSPHGFYGTLSTEADDLGLEWQHSDALISMNDNGKSFAEIADYIERVIPAETSNDTTAKE